MAHVSENVKEFLRQLPASWDDVKFIDGYPGKLYVIARRAGSRWYVAGVNGENANKELTLDLSFLKTRKGRLISTGNVDGDGPSFDESRVTIPTQEK
jgi:alpha-glucosidase